MRQKFWLWLCRFAYRRLKLSGPMPTGIPGNRDPKNICIHFGPRPIRGDNWWECYGDGHYLCEECCHYAPEETEDGSDGLVQVR